MIIQNDKNVKALFKEKKLQTHFLRFSPALE